MCGRYRRTSSEETLARIYNVPLPAQSDLPISWNIAPTQRVLTIRFNAETGERSMDPLRWGLIPHWASATCLEKVKLPAERVLHIDHLFARMQRLNTYEAKTNAMTRIGSNLSQVLPPPFSCE
jgi:putative SOS response-associated peptidase YedK